MTADNEHLAHLRRLLRLEQEEEKARHAALLAELPRREIVARGLAVDDSEAVEESWGLGGRLLVTFRRAAASGFPDTFSTGSVVEAAPRHDADSVAAAVAIVARRLRHDVVLAFDRPPEEFVTGGRVRLTLLPNDVTFERARDAITAVEKMDRGAAARRRAVLLGDAKARFDGSGSDASSSSGSADSADNGAQAADRPAGRGLNAEQGKAFERAMAAEDFFLVHGPPGTGKSTVLAEVAVSAAAAGERIVATAASNAAVDHLLELLLERGLRCVRVGHPARVLPHLVENTLDFLVQEHPDRQMAGDMVREAFALRGYAGRQRRQGRSRERFANAREASREANRLLKEARALERRAVQRTLADAQVVCATCTALAGRHLADARFDLALVDEATQAIEPLALIPFVRAQRLVLAGDHHQLPPTVLSEQAGRAGLGTSLFERLLAVHGDAVRGMLREQYRMHRVLMGFAGEAMYDGALRAHPSCAERDLSGLLGASHIDAPPLLFVDTAGRGFDEDLDPASQSYANAGEAALIVARAQELLDAGLAPAELGVIAPYSAQIALLRRELAGAGVDTAVEVDTVDSFQGREKDVVLLSLTRANDRGELGFLTDLRRMNVAVTRARRHLFAVGDSATLGTHPFYQRFLSYAEGHGGYRSVWEWPAASELTL